MLFPTMLPSVVRRLSEVLRANVHAMGYASPTPIQKAAVPLMLGAHDMMCTAQTGSGKTCAFLLPLMMRLEATGPDRWWRRQDPSQVFGTNTRVWA